jgi:mono/diheme cytochrome c family protein
MRELRRFGLLLAVLALTACERDMRDMYDQPKPHPDATASRFADGRDPRPAPPDIVARTGGVLAASSSGRTERAATTLSPRARLDRGRERYDIYCAPCHSPTGDGDGIVVRRGFPRPQSFHTDAQRALTDMQIDAAIVHGAGAMRPMGRRIDADDRAAIVAYLRALQHSQHVDAGTLDAATRALLDRSDR